MCSTPCQPTARTAVIAGFIALALAMGVGRFAFTPLFPFMHEHAGVTVVGGAWLASANYLGYLVGALAAMRVHVRACIAIRAALLATAVSTLAMGFTSSFTSWLVLRGFAGVASAFLLVCVSTWALERIGPQPLRRAGLFSGVGAGIFGVGSACIAFSKTGTNADSAWILLGLVAFVLTAVVWRMFALPAAAADISFAGGRRTTAWRLVAPYGAAGFGYIIPATFLPVIAKLHTASPLALGIAWPVLGVAAFASTFLAAKLLRGSSVDIWRWAQTGMALGVALPALSPTLSAVIVSGVCVGGTFMVITMSAMDAWREFAGREPRRLIALMTAAFASGQLAGPVVVPFLLGSDSDFSRVLLVSAVMLVAGALALPKTTPASIALTPKEI